MGEDSKNNPSKWDETLQTTQAKFLCTETQQNAHLSY